MTIEDIEAIERATLAAVSPQAQEEISAWVLPFDTGTVRRAKSATPLAHAPPGADLLTQIESRYAARGLPVVLRLPQVAAFDSFRELLTRRGYAGGIATHVQVAATSAVLASFDGSPADMAARPHDGWAAVFLGEGFDPADAKSRIEILSRAPDAVFASIQAQGLPVAAGMVAFSHGWPSVHGMRTAKSSRGQGLARRVLATLGLAALERNCGRMFLQVEEDNAAALALYRRAGFDTAWTYAYWQRDGGSR